MNSLRKAHNPYDPSYRHKLLHSNPAQPMRTEAISTWKFSFSRGVIDLGEMDEWMLQHSVVRRDCRTEQQLEIDFSELLTETDAIVTDRGTTKEWMVRAATLVSMRFHVLATATWFSYPHKKLLLTLRSASEVQRVHAHSLRWLDPWTVDVTAAPHQTTPSATLDESPATPNVDVLTPRRSRS